MAIGQDSETIASYKIGGLTLPISIFIGFKLAYLTT